MYPLELIHNVRLITDVCLEIAPGENVLCITDSEEKMDVITSPMSDQRSLTLYLFEDR